MKKENNINEWLKRAKSNLERAKIGKLSDDILYEDLCYDTQQAVEKSLKALCIKFDIIFPKTHNIEYLIELLEKNDIIINNNIETAKILTNYAIETRYPGEYEPVDKYEYLKALKIAENVVEKRRKWNL